METNTALLVIITVLLTLITGLIVLFMFMVKGLRTDVKAIKAEQEIYPVGIKLFAQGKLKVVGRKVKILK